ncbi:hypothetical protein I8751_04980 [Nostocaceae cyanobacterium CENA357]|uniref:Uncharacterized protein n=1 Tax=Atlanticothrix silvestris CENA357 TaxID=1725252 RepID=A0A8J7KZ04_9CYAN|nr:hypothetical protein [Atlanticothrix silvestris]MBH8551739.1 hypothetical protein [Atlanticothrix silvestris CENA357]
MRSLVALTQALYAYCLQAWWIKVPGVNFELGYSLSPIAETGSGERLQSSQVSQLLVLMSKIDSA